MIGSYARRLWAPDYPWGPTREERDRFCQTIIDEWGGPVGIDERAPSRALDPAFRDWWAAYLRMGASPGAAVALTRMNAEIDIRDVLPSIRVPTLVLHRTGDRCLKIEEGRYLAEHIPGATFVELPGDDHLPFVGDQDAMLSAIDQFLAKVPRVPCSSKAPRFQFWNLGTLEPLIRPVQPDDAVRLADEQSVRQQHRQRPRGAGAELVALFFLEAFRRYGARRSARRRR